MIIIRQKIKFKHIAIISTIVISITLVLVFINLALISPLKDFENTVDTTTVTVAKATAPTKTTNSDNIEYNTEPTEITTVKPTQKAVKSKKTKRKNSDTKQNNNSSNYGSYDEQSSKSTSNSSIKNNSSSSKSNSSPNNKETPKATKKPTQKPTQKATQAPAQETTLSQNNIYLSYSNITVRKGDIVFLNLINASDGVSWSVSNPNILQNYGGGNNQCSYKALNSGTAIITSSYKGINYYCTVTVTN